MPWRSNQPCWNWFWWSAFSGAYHQVTSPATAPPKAAPASSSQPVLTDSQRRRVTDCVHANCAVPVSRSLATAGLPQNIPNRSGAARVSMVSVYTGPSTGPVVSDTICERLPQVPFLAQLASAACQRVASSSPVIRNRTAKAARIAPAMAALTRYWRQMTQVIAYLPQRSAL